MLPEEDLDTLIETLTLKAKELNEGKISFKEVVEQFSVDYFSEEDIASFEGYEEYIEASNKELLSAMLFDAYGYASNQFSYAFTPEGYEQIKTAEFSEYTVIDEDEVVWIVMKTEIDEETFQQNYENIHSELKNILSNDLFDEWLSGAEYKFNAKIPAKYAPDKLDVFFN